MPLNLNSMVKLIASKFLWRPKDALPKDAFIWGLDYSDSFPSVAKMTTGRVSLAMTNIYQ